MRGGSGRPDRQGAFRELDLEPVLGALRRVQLRLLVQQRGEIDLLRGEVDTFVLDSLHVQEVLQQRRQAPCLRVDDAEVVAAGRRVEVPLQQQRGEAEHARERRPELVGDDADELGLHPLALAQLLVLRLQLLAALLAAAPPSS